MGFRVKVDDDGNDDDDIEDVDNDGIDGFELLNWLMLGLVNPMLLGLVPSINRKDIFIGDT